VNAPFSAQTVRHCWIFSEGRCECQQECHDHTGRCSRRFSYVDHGLLGRKGWFAVPWTPLEAGGADAAENAEAICWECYRSALARQTTERAA